MILFKNKFTGFTLVELSIVLIVVSVLIGGVFVGMDVIENSKLQSVATKMISYRDAYKNFRDIHNAYPGDMIDAETVWGASATENGDGDGLIEDDEDANATINRPSENEDAQAWQHMLLAGLINGSFDGVIEASTLIQLGEDIPDSSFVGAGYYMRQQTANVTNATNAISFAKVGDTYDQGIEYPIFSPEQSYYIDKKLDDINPSYGQYVTAPAMEPDDTYYDTADCIEVNSAGDEDDEYALDNYQVRCYGIFYVETAQ